LSRIKSFSDETFVIGWAVPGFSKSREPIINPFTHHTPAVLNPIILQFTVLFESITSCEPTRLSSFSWLGNVNCTNICVRMHIKNF
jgi:hypothetical protein